MRRLLAVLRDTESHASTDPQPSLARLDTLLDHIRRSGLLVTLDQCGADRDLPPGVDLSAYRIVQEALTNVLKHAGPATATVILVRFRRVAHRGRRRRPAARSRGRPRSDRDPRTRRRRRRRGDAGPRRMAASRCAPGCPTGGGRVIRVVLGRRPAAGARRASDARGAEPDIEVVAEAADGREAIAAVPRRRPDVVLMDVRMPVVDGIEATRRDRPRSRTRPAGAGADHLRPRRVRLRRAARRGERVPAQGHPRGAAHHRDPGGRRRAALLAPSVTRRLIEEFARRGPTRAAELRRTHRPRTRGTRLIARACPTPRSPTGCCGEHGEDPRRPDAEEAGLARPGPGGGGVPTSRGWFAPPTADEAASLAAFPARARPGRAQRGGCMVAQTEEALTVNVRAPPSCSRGGTCRSATTPFAQPRSTLSTFAAQASATPCYLLLPQGVGASWVPNSRLFRGTSCD